MNLNNAIGNQAIQDVIKIHPQIGKILETYDIGCVGCSVGICLLKDVVAIHALGADIEAQIENDVNNYLSQNPTGKELNNNKGDSHE